MKDFWTLEEKGLFKTSLDAIKERRHSLELELLWEVARMAGIEAAITKSKEGTPPSRELTAEHNELIQDMLELSHQKAYQIEQPAIKRRENKPTEPFRDL
jgi:citrate lyase synthetase